MKDQYKTKAQLIEELEQTRKRVTELEHTAEGPEVFETKYRELFELSPIGITILDMKGIITSCNPAVTEKSGYSSEEVIGKHFSKIAPLRAKDIQKYVKIFASIIRGKIPKPFEVTFQNKDGTTGWSEICVSLLRVEGRRVGVQALQRDTTKRKQVEKSLHESEERFKSLADQSPNMIFVNKKGRIVYVNKRCEEVMGYTREEFYSPDFDFLTLIAPESLELIKANFLKHMKGKNISPYEYTIITKGGKRIEAINAARLISYKGDTAILAVITDITERKRSEEALREMATIDPLTSLNNRRRFSELLAHEIDRTIRYQTDLSLIMFDIDHFKKINDTYGHKVGDNVLKMFGARMKDNIRESDIIARWGGEEFLILAVNSDLEKAQTIAEKIRADIESQHLAGATKFTVSAGVCQFEYDEDATTFIDRADKALYRAKNDGRNRVRVASLKQPNSDNIQRAQKALK